MCPGQLDVGKRRPRYTVIGVSRSTPATDRMTAGDEVRLRSPQAILQTLDEDGCCDGLPFMPEMFAYYGRTFRVAARVERACDTIEYSGVRRLRQTVILDDLRCNGTGHDGCGAQCRIYWKEAWLEPASTSEDEKDPAAIEELRVRAARGVRQVDSPGAPTYRCQATELLRASERVPSAGMRSLFGELTNHNVGFVEFVKVMTRIVVEALARRLRLLGTAPFRPGELTPGKKSSPAARELRPGELVQIRTKAEIGKTLGPDGKNRGLWFDREMVPYCGQQTRVRAKVTRFIDETNGRMIDLASDCYILEDVVCKSSRSDGRWFCPRAIYPWWRVGWLEPVSEEEPSGS